MRGSVRWQVNTVFRTIIKIGESRHKAKQSVSYSNPHELGQKTGVHSYKTLNVYRDVARDLLNYAKTEGLTKDIEKITPEIVKSYLENKLEQGRSYSTMKTYCAAVNKLGVALETYNGQQYDFYSATQKVLETARQGGMGPVEQHRAFEYPEKVIANIQDSSYKVIAKFQLASGLRLSEMNHIKPEQLREKNGKCYVEVHKGKGGKNRTVEVRDREAFKNFKNLVEQNKQTSGKYLGKFIFNKRAYTGAIKEAAREVGERVTKSGSHCFRWCYAQREFNRLQIEEGHCRQEALLEVAENLGHNREEITEHYLQ